MTFYNMFIGKETLTKEFKEFRFNMTKSYKMTRNKASEYCETNKFEFNDLVIENIIEYIKYYIPKYFCAFINSSINGELYIGVDDYGFIKGIPYQGELDINFLNNKILKYLYKNIKTDIQYSLEDFIEITWEKIQMNEIPSTTHPTQYYKYLEEKKVYDEKYNKWVEDFEDWKAYYSFVNRKLVNTLNTPESRLIIIDYINKHSKELKLIELLKTDTFIDFEEEKKTDPNNPYYWVIRWKNETIDKLKREKPIFNYKFENYNTPINLINNIGDMIPYWFHNEQNMNLYLLKITFKWAKPFKNNFMYLENKDTWKTIFRTIIDGEPCRITLV